MKKIALFSAFFIFLATTFWVRSTKSFFNDTEKITGNVLLVATSWVSGTPTPESTPTPTAEPTATPSAPVPELTSTPTPTATPVASHLVINEVYYDVGLGKGDEPANEWIEIYNASSQPVDLQNWQLCDNQYCRSITASSQVLRPGNFAVITNNESTWGYWTMPPEALKVVLSPSLSLGNDGDRVILKDNSGNVVDKMSYGNDSSVFNPPCPDIAAGHSLERSPAGKDTDTAGDFVDRSSPTPGS